MLDYTVKMARDHHEATEADVQRLRDVGFTDADILHIIYWIASFNMANTISDCAGLEVHEHMTAVFVEDLPAGSYGQLGHEASSMAQREALRAGQERAVVRALEGLDLEWLNSRPLGWGDAAGKVLLVIYWDATHPNSLLAVEALSRWHADLAGRGLLVIAAHTPEYPAAKDPALVRAEVQRLGIRFPVVLDAGFRKMAGANNRYWPAVHLVDSAGFVRLRHYGPGGLGAIEAALRQLLDETPGDPRPRPLAHRHADGWLHPGATAEVYPTTYAPSGLPLDARVRLGPLDEVDRPEPGALYLEGDWAIGEQGARLEGQRGAALLSYNARAVGIFMSPGAAPPATLVSRVDGGPAEQTAIASPRCYMVARHEGLERHTLRLELLGQGAVLHRISFLPFRADADEEPYEEGGQ